MTPFETKRKAAGFTQAGVASRLKISQSAVGKWDRGIAKPSPRFYPKLSKLLGVKPDEMVELFEPS